MSNGEAIKKLREGPGKWPDVSPMAFTDGGWFLPCNADLLMEHIRVNMGCIVELGSWLGMSTRWLYEHTMPHCQIIAIDHWKGSPENQNDPIVSTVYERFINNCKEGKDRLIPLRMDTQSGLRLLKEVGLKPDLVFIDAGHDHDSAKADILSCLEFGCPLVGDDFNPYDWLGVTKAVWEVARDKNFTAKFKFKAWSIDPRSRT